MTVLGGTGEKRQDFSENFVWSEQKRVAWRASKYYHALRTEQLV